MNNKVTIEAYQELLGTTLGPSSWIDIPQEKINRFADVTGDHQFIHVDVERARKTPIGGTIAHGYLTLSLLPQMIYEVVPVIDGLEHVLNYGLDRLRFLCPVPAGARVRGRFTPTEFKQTQPGQYQLLTAAEVEIDGYSKPALVAELRAMAFVL